MANEKALGGAQSGAQTGSAAGPIGAVIGAGVGLIGGAAADAAAEVDRVKAQRAIEDAYKYLQQVGLPPDSAKAIIYNQYKQKGLLTPELEKAINAGPSKMEGVTGSKEGQQAQLQALQILQQRGQTGLTPEDRAALNQIRQQVAADTRAKQQAIQQQFAARGQGGSGAELIGALQAAQSGTNQASIEGDRLAAMASQNALQSIGQAGTLGGQINQQQFGQQAEKAKAQDVINMFNAQNQVGQQARNVGAQNQAQAGNLAAGQQIQNANTQQSNQELLRQNQAARQNYLDKLGYATTLQNASLGYAANMNQMGSEAGKSAAAPYAAIGAAVPAVTNYIGSRSTSGSQPAANSGSNKFTDDEWAGNFAHGGVADYRNGTHKVPGKAEVPGDDPRNDTVHAMLSPGEAVVPRSVMKTSFGKKLAKLLEQHHEVMKHAGEDNE